MGVTDRTSGVSYATLSLAISGSATGDVLAVPAGSYVEDFPKITHSLTIEGVGGIAVLTNPQAAPPNGSAVLDVAFDAGASLTVANLDISGAANDPSSNNGAGIRFEGGNGTLRVSNSFIHGNQDGILTGAVDAASPDGVMSVFIDHSEIANNGVDASNPAFGYDHNIYAGALTELSVTDSYLHDALGGHEVKSRAAQTVITGNRIADGPVAQSGYDIDLADGGVATVSGNTIEKGPDASNRSMIHFGGEGTYAGSSLNVSDNVFINDRAAGAIGVLNQTSDAGGHNVAASITDNTLYNVGAGNLSLDANAGPADSASGNMFMSGGAPALDTSAGYSTACFAEGTRIATSRGAIAVEDLRAGDLAVLARGGVRPVIWVGSLRVRFAAGAGTPWPVRVRAHTFGAGAPVRDLVLSPEHAVFAGDVLVPVGELVDGCRVRRLAMEAVTYWHVELDRHDVILAEGLAVESYLENANRWEFVTRSTANPAWPSMAGMKTPCLPRVRQGMAVERARAALATPTKLAMRA